MGSPDKGGLTVYANLSTWSDWSFSFDLLLRNHVSAMLASSELWSQRRLLTELWLQWLQCRLAYWEGDSHPPLAAKQWVGFSCLASSGHACHDKPSAFSWAVT